MRQYRSLVRVLDRDLAVRPLPETTRLYDDVRAGRLGPPPVPVAAPAMDEAASLGEAAALDEEPAAAEAATAGTPTWPLVGRTAELASLRAAWQAADGGGGHDGAGHSGRVVGVAGQAGSGKTRLITPRVAMDERISECPRRDARALPARRSVRRAAFQSSVGR